MSALIPELCSVHTHSSLCDGANTPQEMAAAAWSAGVRYFGFSGHTPTPSPEDAGNTLPVDLTEYRQTVLALREEYAGRMEILLGIEQDSQALCPVPEGLDYWIGSVHDLHDPETNRYYAVDWKPEVLAACCIEMFHGDFPALVSQYYTDVAAMAARKPTILGHIDLITKLNGDGELFDEEDRHYRMAALDALHAADPAATLLEVNTGAISRGYRKTPYPADFLLAEWKRMGGRIILTSDAHSKDTITFGYRQAVELAQVVGYRETVILTNSGQVVCAI